MFGQFQRTLAALSTPLTSAVPVSEFVVNFASAFQPSLSEPETPINSQHEPDNIPTSPARYVPPPHYVTDPPLSRPDFDASGSDDSQPPVPLLSQETNIQPSQQLPLTPDNFELSSPDDEQPLPHPPPSLQPQPRTLSQPAQRVPCTRLSQPLPPIPQTVSAMAYAPQQGITAMPSARSKLALYFSGKTEHSVEDFLEEYEGLVSRTQSVTTRKQETRKQSLPKAAPKPSYSHVVQTNLRTRDPGKVSPDVSCVTSRDTSTPKVSRDPMACDPGNKPHDLPRDWSST